MAYDAAVLRRATRRLEEERKVRQANTEALRKKLYAQCPELADIDRQLKGTILDIITSCLKQGTDPAPALGVLKDKNMDLQHRQALLLQEAGYPPDALDDIPACKKCNDAGWVGTQMCDCLKTLCTQEQVKELSKLLDLGEQSFDHFSLEWYSPLPWPGEGVSPRENMDWIYRTCKRYAAAFGPRSGNLLLTGDPGLGKTFLSAAIAREVSAEGYSVVYDTAVHIFDRFEARKFGRELGEAVEADVDRVSDCDLLILDDLGTEMTTPFVQSALYSILNGRITDRRATILSTNLKLDELARRYTPQIASRIEGEYQLLPFFGEDIRRLRKERG